MKKFLAVTLAGIAAAGCVAAGCSANPRNFASLSSNWYTYPDNKQIQPAFTEGNEGFAPEKISYKVTQTVASDNGAYSVEYADGVYRTEFYAKKVRAADLENITAEEWRADYTQALGGAENENEKFMVLYYYKTELSLPSVTYKFGNESKTFENESRVTESYFLSVADYLGPVYSRQRITGSSPESAAPVKPASIEECYTEYDAVTENFYTLAGSDVKTLVHDNKTGNTDTYFVSGLSSNKYSVFDAAYLDVAARGLKGSAAGSSQTVSLYSPSSGLGAYTVSGSNAPLSADADRQNAELTKIRETLKSKNLLSEEDGEGPATVALDITYVNGIFTGASPRYWFANEGSVKGKRTVMVKFLCPIAYGCGELQFLLDEIESLPMV